MSFGEPDARALPDRGSDLRSSLRGLHSDVAWSSGARWNHDSSVANSDDDSTLVLKVHPPRNLKGDTGGGSIFCTIKVVGSCIDLKSPEHHLTSFPTGPVTLQLSAAGGWNQVVHVRFWANELGKERKLMAETCLPLEKLLECGVTAFPLWAPFWLGLFPAGERAFGEQAWQLGAEKPGILFDDARRMAESLEHQKVCVDINAARCSRWFPRSESKLQKMILAYNRQIESYHKQTEDDRCLSVGLYVYLQDPTLSRGLEDVRKDAQRYKLVPAKPRSASDSGDDSARSIAITHAQDLAKAEHKLATAELALEELRSELQMAQGLADKAVGGATRVSELLFEREQLAAQAEKLASENRTWSESFGALQNENRSKAFELSSLQAELDANRLQWHTLESDLKEQTSNCAQLSTTVTGLQEQLDELHARHKQEQSQQVMAGNAEQPQDVHLDAFATPIHTLAVLSSDGEVQTDECSAEHTGVQTQCTLDQLQSQDDSLARLAGYEQEQRLLQETIEAQDSQQASLREELTKLHSEVAVYKVTTNISEDEEKRLRLLLAERDAELASSQQEMDGLRSDLHLSRDISGGLADSAQEANSLAMEERNRREDLSWILQERERTLALEQQLASQQKTMLDQVQKEVQDQAKRLVAKDSALQQLQSQVSEIGVPLKPIERKAHVDLVPSALVNSMYSELQESQARAVASLKAEKAECARLNATLAKWNTLGERMGRHLQRAPFEDRCKRSDLLNNSSGQMRASGDSLSSTDTGAALKAILEEAQAERKDQLQHLMQLQSAEHSRSATLFVRSDASYSASPRRSSSLASDRRPVRDDLAAEILELRQETSRLWHSSPQRSARIHSEEAVRRHVTGPASPAALNGNAPSRQVLPLQAQEVDPMREVRHIPAHVRSPSPRDATFAASTRQPSPSSLQQRPAILQAGDARSSAQRSRVPEPTSAVPIRAFSPSMAPILASGHAGGYSSPAPPSASNSAPTFATSSVNSSRPLSERSSINPVPLNMRERRGRGALQPAPLVHGGSSCPSHANTYAAATPRPSGSRDEQVAPEGAMARMAAMLRGVGPPVVGSVRQMNNSSSTRHFEDLRGG